MLLKRHTKSPACRFKAMGRKPKGRFSGRPFSTWSSLAMCGDGIPAEAAEFRSCGFGFLIFVLEVVAVANLLTVLQPQDAGDCKKHGNPR
jgi:hypothetical protein